jgi:glycosyltransferase involved in cell wall biosynthesis
MAIKKRSINHIHPWQSKPVISKTHYLEKKALWTMVMPVFNQADKLNEILLKVRQNASLPFEIIFINDGSSDRTLECLQKICSTLNLKDNNKIVSSTIIHNEFPIFETACDNQGFRLAQTEYIIEIQSDIHIEEQGFDQKMICAMQKYNFSTLSGRHIHNFSLLDSNNPWAKYPLLLMKWRILKIGSESFGKIGKKIFQKEKCQPDDCYIGETVSRGPWLIKKSDLENYDYLDEKNFFLGNDDHDFNRKLYENENRNSGYIPLNIYSVAEDGSTRKKRHGINKKIYDFLKKKKKGSLGYINFLRDYKPYCKIQKLTNKKIFI